MLRWTGLLLCLLLLATTFAVSTAQATRTPITSQNAGQVVELKKLQGMGVDQNILAWSPDSRQLATHSGSGSRTDVWIWDVETGTIVTRFGRSKTYLEALAWSPDGKYLAAGGRGQLLIYDVEGQTIYHEISIEPAIYVSSLVWSPDSTVLGVAQGRVYLFDVLLKQPMVELEGYADVILWSPDGQQVATLREQVKIYNAITGENLITFPIMSIGDSFDWSPDGLSFVVESSLNGIEIWNPGTEIVEAQWEGTVPDWSPDGSLIAGALESSVYLWDLEGQQLAELEGHTDEVEEVVFSPDGTLLATGGEDEIVIIWHVPEGAAQAEAISITPTTPITPDNVSQVQEITHLSEEIVDEIALSPDNQWIAISKGNEIDLVNLAQPDTSISLGSHTGKVLDLDWSPDSTLLASVGADTLLRLWDVATQQEAGEFAGHSHWVNAVAWSPDGTQLVTVSRDNTLRSWDVASQTQLTESIPHEGLPVWDVTWSGDGTRLVTVGADNTVAIWDAASGELLQRNAESVDGATLVRLSPDGTLLTWANSSGQFFIWKPDTGAAPRLYGQQRGGITDMAWSPDSLLLLTAGNEQQVHVWNINRGAVGAYLRDFEGLPVQVQWSADGSLFVTGDQSGKVRLWGLP